MSKGTSTDMRVAHNLEDEVVDAFLLKFQSYLNLSFIVLYLLNISNNLMLIKYYKKSYCSKHIAFKLIKFNTVTEFGSVTVQITRLYELHS